MIIPSHIFNYQTNHRETDEKRQSCAYLGQMGVRGTRAGRDWDAQIIWAWGKET